MSVTYRADNEAPQLASLAIDTLRVSYEKEDGDRAAGALERFEANVTPTAGGATLVAHADGVSIPVVDAFIGDSTPMTADTRLDVSSVDAFMKACKAAAKRHQIVIICLSELARGAYRGGNDQTNDLAATKESGGIEYAQEKMYAYRKQALDILSAFPESPARKSLYDLVIYTTEREK